MYLNLKLIALCAIAALCSFSAVAQNADYVITTNNDSIPCKISTNLFGGISYKVDSSSNSVKIKPAEIKLYYISKKKELTSAVLKPKSSKYQFMKVLERGKINLYEDAYNTGGYMSPTGGFMPGSNNQLWYISKGTDTVTEIKKNNIELFGKSRSERKADFERFISDNQAVLEKYKTEDKFSFKQLRNLVHLYNTGEPFKEE
jgi:hypothetical protein